MILHCFKIMLCMDCTPNNLKKVNFMEIDQINKEESWFFCVLVVFFSGATGSRLPGCPITTPVPPQPPPTD